MLDSVDPIMIMLVGIAIFAVVFGFIVHMTTKG